MPNDDEIIAAYVRERKPELLDTLSFIIYAAMYRATAAIKGLGEKLDQLCGNENGAEPCNPEGADEPNHCKESDQTE